MTGVSTNAAKRTRPGSAHGSERTAILPDIALVSTAVRAQQTWDYISPYMPHCRIKYLDDLYLATTEQLLQIIHGAQRDDPAALMVIGHNPGLHELAWNLTGKSNAADRRALGENLPTAAAAVIDFQTGWQDVVVRGGTLKVFMSPKRFARRIGSRLTLDIRLKAKAVAANCPRYMSAAGMRRKSCRPAR